MSRAALVWGGAASAVLGLGAVLFAITVALTATPEAHVQRYLEALAVDDLTSAALLAGLEPGTAMPFGDDGEPSILRIVGRTDGDDGTVSVLAEYGTEADAATASFSLVAGEPRLGIVPTWRFAQPPVRTLEVRVDEHDRFTVNDRALVADGAGDAVSVTGFVLARITARVDEPLLDAEPVSVRLVPTALEPIELIAMPNDRLERRVASELELFLKGCTDQEVLLPAGCPFGRQIDDRVVDRPRWELVDPPTVAITAGEHPGRWAVRGDAQLRLIVTVQALFDGALSERDEVVDAVLRGELELLPEGPRLRLYPPED